MSLLIGVNSGYVFLAFFSNIPLTVWMPVPFILPNDVTVAANGIIVVVFCVCSQRFIWFLLRQYDKASIRFGDYMFHNC